MLINFSLFQEAGNHKPFEVRKFSAVALEPLGRRGRKYKYGEPYRHTHGAATWALPWPCVQEFLAIVTHSRIYAPPTPLNRALDQVDAWLESPTLALIAESAAHWPTLRALIAGGRVAGPQVHDARIVALCRQHGVRELWSADRDFSRFAGLAVVNPLIRSG